MSDKSEALRLEAETVSGLMVQLAENDIDSDSFAVMSDLGENGTEHECDLPITETALRAAAVIGQLLAALEEANKQLSGEESVSDMTRDSAKYWKQRAEAAEQRLQQSAIADVMAERQRQVGAEGYDHFHDDSHVNDEIAALAAWYVMPQGARGWDTTSSGYGDTLGQAILPGWRQPTEKDRRRELVIGAALTLAEIERLDRAAANLEEGR